MPPGPTLPLREQYPSEYNSWKNVKTRAKKERVGLDNRFILFADFMKHMGPKPDRTYTVDRIESSGPYTLENVRWADKITQANNRRNTRRVLHNGEMRPASEVARLTGQVPDTVRKRALREGTFLKPKRPVQWRRTVSVPSAASGPPTGGYVEDKYRWVHEDDREVSFWLGLYRHGEGDETGTWELVEQVPASGGGLRRETLREFMARMDAALVYALTTGDVGNLPLVLADKISAFDEAQRADVLTVSRDRLERNNVFKSDPLVTDLKEVSCDISWMFKAPEDVDFSYVIQQAHTRFVRAGKALPVILRQRLELQSKKPLGRKSF